MRLSLAPPPDSQNDLIRGISASTLMMRTCLCLAASSLGPDIARRWYDYSAPTKQLSHFLSHCWHDGRWEKALALMLYSSRFSLIWCTSLVVTLVAVVQLLQLLPMPAYSFVISGSLSTNGLGCQICGCVLWCLLLALAPQLHMWETWFLDKACICQHDEELKKQGIQQLGTFLECSERMVLLLSPKYFERGWCTFEVATFMANHGIHAVDLVPLLRAKLVLSTFGVSVFGIVVFHACTALGIVDAVASIQPQPVIRGIPAYTFLVWLAPTGLVLGFVAQLLERYMEEQRRILQQVAGFRFSRAKFAEESDRAFVFQSIEALFGSLTEFEVEVQTEVLQKVTQELGDDHLPLRFSAIVTGTLPWIWWGVDMTCTDALEFKLGDILMGAVLGLGLLPAWFVALVGLERCKHRLVSAHTQWVQRAGSAGLFVIAVVSSTLLIAMTLQVLIVEAVPSKLFVSALWAAVASACFGICSCCCILDRDKARMSRELIPAQDAI